MCRAQDIACNCCWYNCLGVLAAGCACGFICMGFWCLPKDDMLYERDDNCCVCCEQVGCGCNLCFAGYMCCAPKWLRSWSLKKNSFYK